MASLKLAIVLMLMLVGLSLIGTFVIQVPAEYASAPQKYYWWLENIALAQTGAWYPLLRLMGFFNIFHSPWFILTGLLLTLNIIVCSLNRLKQLSARLDLRQSIPAPGYFQDNKNSRVFRGIRSIDTLVSFLNKRGYRTTVVSAGQETYLFAVKNRFSPLGVYLVHASLILFILGFVIGHYWGFNNSSFTVAEGQTREVGYDTSLSLKLEAFQAEHYSDGSPKDFRSQVTLTQNQTVVKNGLVRVNHPLKYQGVRFYQSYFGPAVMISITENGQPLFSGMVALDNFLSKHPYTRPSGKLILTEPYYSIHFLAPATNLFDPVLKKEQLAIEVFRDNQTQALESAVITLNNSLTVGNLEITYSGGGHFSGFLVNSAPGAGFIWAASVFLLFGLAVLLFFPRRQMRAALLFNSAGGLDLYLRWENKAVDFRDDRQSADLLNTVSAAMQSQAGKEQQP